MTSSPPAPATKIVTEQNIVDVITYTASLSSDPKIIDPLLDTLRTITSRGSTSFSAQEVNTLHELQDKLEHHLVHQEKVRSFTHESLQFHIKEHFSGSSRLKNLKWVTGGIVLLAVILGTVAGLLNVKNAPDRSALMGLSVLYAVLYLGMAGLFKEATKELTREARTAYTYIFVAMSTIGIVMLIHPIVALTTIQHHPIASTVLTIPQIISFVILYLGVRKIAQLIEVQGLATSIKFMWFGSVVVVALAFLAPLVLGMFRPYYPPYPYFVSAMIFQGMHSFLLGMTALVLRRVYKNLNDFYARGIKALMLGVITYFLVSTYFLIFYWPFIGELYANIYLAAGLIGMFFVAVAFLRAAYIFNKVHHN